MRVNKTIHIPVEVGTSPKSGGSICNNYWIVHPDMGLVFYNPEKIIYNRVGSPQCNADKRVIKELINSLEVEEGKTYKDMGYKIKKVRSVFIESCLEYAIKLNKVSENENF